MGRRHVGIAVQRVAQVVRVLFVHAGQSKIRKPLSGLNVELTRVLGSGTHGEKCDDGAEDALH